MLIMRYDKCFGFHLFLALHGGLDKNDLMGLLWPMCLGFITREVISNAFFSSLHAESPPPPYSRYPMDYLKPPGELTHIHI